MLTISCQLTGVLNPESALVVSFSLFRPGLKINEPPCSTRALSDAPTRASVAFVFDLLPEPNSAMSYFFLNQNQAAITAAATSARGSHFTAELPPTMKSPRDALEASVADWLSLREMSYPPLGIILIYDLRFTSQTTATMTAPKMPTINQPDFESSSKFTSPDEDVDEAELILFAAKKQKRANSENQNDGGDDHVAGA